MLAPTAIHGGAAPLASLTSIFTPPCPTSWLITTTRLLSQYPAFPTTGPASCDPPSWTANLEGRGFQYYSPAICPQGFVVGPGCGLTKTRTEEGFPTVAPQETVAYCVPSGLSCTTDTTDYRGGVWGLSREATTFGARVTVGPAIQIRWREADLTMLETHPLTPGLKVARTNMAAQAVATAVILSYTTSISIPTSAPQPTDVLITDTTLPAAHSPKDSGLFPAAFPTGPSAPSKSTNTSGGGLLGSLNRTNSIIVIVVITLVGVSILATAALILVRRNKRKELNVWASAEAGNRASTWPGPSNRGTFMSAASSNKVVRDVRSTTPASSKKISTNLDPRGRVSELHGSPPPSAVRLPVLGSVPNPAELEGDMTQMPTRLWAHNQRSWLRSPSLQQPLQSPRSVRSFGRRTVRESFGEKINDPATVLGRLKIPSTRSTMTRPSPNSASPAASSFWRIPRSPRSPKSPRSTMTTRRSQLSHVSPIPSPMKLGLSGDVATPTIPEHPQEETGESSSNTQRESRP
ncbi:hypothetical protein QBC42DRAFT_108070 [Cladorrhinum samala]|uniref:Uncharacterized protein n=1 Tax=Cladorrhinum samala TaxID=585594 RepID=A0AAV9I1U1_9PEZI|nr:hypothetical protein QBC42DRAFT_108070 [Cladorrhinum samala]